jgi:hypothetical protein
MLELCEDFEVLYFLVTLVSAKKTLPNYSTASGPLSHLLSSYSSIQYASKVSDEQPF